MRRVYVEAPNHHSIILQILSDIETKLEPIDISSAYFNELKDYLKTKKQHHQEQLDSLTSQAPM